MLKSKVWYKSKTVLALIAAVICVAVLPRLGYPLPEEYSKEILTALVAVILYGLRDAQGGIDMKTPKKEDEGNGAG